MSTLSNFKKLVLVTTVLATTSYILFQQFKNKSEQVYCGKINELDNLSVDSTTSISYIEKKFDNIFNNENVLTIKKDDLTYVLKDKRNEKNLNWKNIEDEPLTDALEEIIIKRDNVEINKYVHNIDYFNLRDTSKTIDTEISKHIFDKFNKYYNYERDKIRKILKTEYAKNNQWILDSVNNITSTNK